MAYISKKNTFMDFVIRAIIVSILFENMQIISIMGAGFKLLHLILILCILRQLITRPLKLKALTLGIIFLLIPVLPLYRINDIVEWFKSYVIYVILVLFFVTSLEEFCHCFSQKRVTYVRFFIKTIAVSQVLGIIQFVMMNAFGVFFLKDFFGPFAFHHCQFGVSAGFYRAYSLFFEPSFFAWVCNAALAVLLYCGNNCFSTRKKNWYLGLTLIALFSTLSSSGIIIGVCILVLNQFVFSKNAGKIFVACIGTFFVILFIWLFTDLLSPIERLFYEINTENTSGYERLITPLLYIEQTFRYFPICGRGIGQEGYVDAVGVIGRYPGIHNALLGIIACFGLTSLFFYVPAISYCVKRVSENRKWALLLVSLGGIYISTGAFIAVDTFLFLILILAVGHNENV